MSIKTSEKIKDVVAAPREFYALVLKVAVPIMLQNGITNFVNMLDNIMVGHIGTDAMSGVSIVNQLLFVYYLCIFGGLAGIGIFTAQFWGKGDMRGMRYTVRAKLMLGAVLAVLGCALLLVAGKPLIGAFLHEGGETGDMAETMRQARMYLNVMLVGLFPMALANVYSSTLREKGQTVVPMAAGITAVLVNLAGNYILIYGKFGAPALGVRGAAAATVISRFVEALIVVIWTHTHPKENPFVRGCYSSLRVPADLIKSFFKKGMPLLVNEALWSAGMTTLVQCYSVRGLTSVAALNISNTLSNLFNIVFLSMGSVTAIILGQRLGAGKTHDIKLYAYRLMFVSLVLSVATGAVLFAVSPYFPGIYNTTEEVKTLAHRLLMISAVFTPVYSFSNSCYFTLRSGGKTLITFLFDSCFCWAISVPAAFLLSRFTGLSTENMFFAVQTLELIKNVSGLVLVHRGRWINDITKYTEKG